MVEIRNLQSQGEDPTDQKTGEYETSNLARMGGG